MISLLPVLFQFIWAQGELVDFAKIRDVLKNDMLEQEARKRELTARQTARRKRRQLIARYDIPREKEFWTFLSEYWLVKNAKKLNWDIRTPDYGIEQGFRRFLQTLGISDQKIHILFLGSKDITHFALPANPKECILLLSVPFMKELDLSRQEIYVLLFQDYLRAKAGYFREFVSKKKVRVALGKNFYKKKFNRKVLEQMQARYQKFIFSKGFTFQQQYKITRQMAEHLENHIKLWNGYTSVLKKIDQLLKSEPTYKHYLKIYPSPELQLGWLAPK